MGATLGQGTTIFRPVFEVLARRGYKGWISLEAFDFTPGPERIATESLKHLQAEAARVAAS